MVESPNSNPTLAVALLIHYSFDMGSDASPEQTIIRWARYYDADWIYLAIIEALYQGRYKVFSVEQILNFWQRRGYVTYHFNAEFERLVCNRMPKDLHARFQATLGLYRLNPSALPLSSTLSSALSFRRQRKQFTLPPSPDHAAFKANEAVDAPIPAPLAYPDFILKLRTIIDNSQRLLPTSGELSPNLQTVTIEPETSEIVSLDSPSILDQAAVSRVPEATLSSLTSNSEAEKASEPSGES
ncbi:MAG: hypothetical protein ACRC8A_16985 [Microcoleaceae cyanobacterium]